VRHEAAHHHLSSRQVTAAALNDTDGRDMLVTLASSSVSMKGSSARRLVEQATRSASREPRALAAPTSVPKPRAPPTRACGCAHQPEAVHSVQQQAQRTGELRGKPSRAVPP